jgi:ribosome-interacting GTPase 1
LLTHVSVYIPALVVLNKIDAINIDDELKDSMWTALDLVRVYTKPKGKKPDYTQPVVLRRSKCKVSDFCDAIHKEIKTQFKHAIVYGTSAKHSRGQKVGLDHILEDEE